VSILPTGVTFSGMTLDRASALRRDPQWLARLLRERGTRAVAASSDGVLLDEGPATALPRFIMPGLEPDQADPILLGLEEGHALFALDLDALEPAIRSPLLPGRRVAPLREAGAVLSQSEGGLAAYLVALLNWHRRHPHCSVCGALTAIGEGGLSRCCPACGAIHFPRTDPAVIVLVSDGDRVLLGRHREWPPAQYSILAGFVSPGESLEEAVAREVLEEAGIEVRDPVFVTSQPWPFPSSLMLGFKADSDGGEPTARDGELEDVRWFTRDEVGSALAVETTGLRLPPSVSISRLLVELWWSKDL
jgi:NAD+ diphosphatase